MSQSQRETRNRERQKLSFISLTILIGSLILLFLIVLISWRAFMPPGDTKPEAVNLTDQQIELAEKLEADVRYLAEAIGERNMNRDGSMSQTASWIEGRMNEIGLEPYRHTYTLQRGMYQNQTADNIIVDIPGTKSPEKIVLIGAHYDSVIGSPGANDNGSAVASLLALAEWFKNSPKDKTVRFVAFANEEPPFFKTEDMGSYVYARELAERKEELVAMISMDGLGYYSDRSGSQNYPIPGIGWFYPSEANFIAFVTRFGDLGLMKNSLNRFRKSTPMQAEGVALPEMIPGVSWSDHWSFWQHDFPAFLVTDTLPFRDPNYHSAGDTPNRLDYERVALVTVGLKSVVSELASISQ